MTTRWQMMIFHPKVYFLLKSIHWEEANKWHYFAPWHTESGWRQPSLTGTLDCNQHLTIKWPNSPLTENPGINGQRLSRPSIIMVILTTIHPPITHSSSTQWSMTHPSNAHPLIFCSILHPPILPSLPVPSSAYSFVTHPASPYLPPSHPESILRPSLPHLSLIP